MDSILDTKCERRGHVWLTHVNGETIVMETSCHTRRCRNCAPKLRSLFVMLVKYGIRISIPQHFYFITVTLKAGKGLEKDAAYVATKWPLLLRFLKKSYGPNLMWVRVIELTQRKQPHLHLILTFGPGINPRAYCQKEPRYNDEWLSRTDCDCLEHRIGFAWLSITGDSYVIDARPILPGDEEYIAKYVAKSFRILDEMGELGFHRSWSRSRNWPVDRLQLLATKEEQWANVEFAYWMAAKPRPQEASLREWLDRSETHVLKERVGTELSLAFAEEAQKKRLTARVKKLWRHFNVSSEEHNSTRPSSGGSGPGRGVGPRTDGRSAEERDRGASRHRG